MNRSFRTQESLMLDSVERQRQQLRASMMAENEEELALFLEMRRRDKQHDNLLLNNPEEFETPLGAKPGTSPVFNISMVMPSRKSAAPDDFLNSEGDKNDYEWLLTPPDTPLFPSLEMESHKTMLSHTGDSKARLNSRLSNSSMEPAARSNIASRQTTSSPGLSSSSGASRRPSSSGGPGSRPATPTGRSTLTTNSRSSRPSTPSSRATLPSTTRPSITNSRTSVSAAKTTSASWAIGSPARLTPTATKLTAAATKPTGSASRSTMSTTKPAGPSRSTTPLSRSTTRSSTPTSRATLPPPKTISRSATPTRRPISSTSVPSTKPTISQVKPSSPVAKAMPIPLKNPSLSRGTSPTARSRPWKPSDMPGFSLETPPNLRKTLPDRPLSATRGRPGAPSPRSASVEPGGLTGRPRRQSCSPSRGRAPIHPVMIGTNSSIIAHPFSQSFLG